MLASGKKLPKWDARCVLGLYLGNSPRYIRSVSQVFNLNTGRVSPQFHVIHDEFFGTIALQDKFHTNWKHLSDFTPVISTLPVQSPNSTPPLPTYTPISDPSPILHHDLDDYLPPLDIFVEQPPEPSTEPSYPLRRSTRNRQPTREMLQSVGQHDLEFCEFYGDTYTPRTIPLIPNIRHTTNLFTRMTTSCKMSLKTPSRSLMSRRGILCTIIKP